MSHCYICGSGDIVTTQSFLDIKRSWCDNCSKYVDIAYKNALKVEKDSRYWRQSKESFLSLFNEAHRLALSNNWTNHYQEHTNDYYPTFYNKLRYIREAIRTASKSSNLGQNVGAYISSVKSKDQKEQDPYKEHEKQLKNNKNYQQYLLNEHECELCGNKGKGAIRIEKIQNRNFVFCHELCYEMIRNYALVTNHSIQDSFEALKEKLFVKKEKEVKQNKEQNILCSADFFCNPWNR